MAACSSRFLAGAFVSSDFSSRIEAIAISSTAPRNATSFAFEGLLKPVIFLTNCKEASRTSSGVTGGSKLKSVLMFLHIDKSPCESVSVKFLLQRRQRLHQYVAHNGKTAWIHFVQRICRRMPIGRLDVEIDNVAPWHAAANER